MLADAAPLSVERIALADAAGRVLAEAVHAAVDLPPWDNAAMDGYAVRADDVAGASPTHPVALTVRATIAAGDSPSPALGPREAARIMTGAPVPAGCDTVVRVEDTDAGVDRVRIMAARDRGRNVRARAEDLAAGTVAVPVGVTLGPAWIGVLAAAGAGHVAVHRRPRVAVLASGDELVTLDRYEEVLAARRIVSTNSYTLTALAQGVGAEVTNLGIVADTPAAWAAALTTADRYDLLLTSGGASVGAFDFAREAAAARGFALDFWRVAVRPASQTAFGRLGATRWLAVPGNPVSAMIAFELFARPLLRRWLGHRLAFRRAVRVVLDEAVHASASVAMLYRVSVTTDATGLLVARLTGPQGSGLLTSMGRANALLHVPQGVTTIAAGDSAMALPLDDASALADSFPFDA